MVFDTNEDKVLRTIETPGSVHHMVPLSDHQVLISVTNPDGKGGNVYVVDRITTTPNPLFPEDLMPFATGQIVLDYDSQISYFLYSCLPSTAVQRRNELKQLLTDEKLLDSHIDVWDLQTLQLSERIYLSLPSAQSAVLGPDGMLCVGHMDMTGSNPVSSCSVVDPSMGAVREVSCVENPAYLLIHDDQLYVSSWSKPVMEVRRLPDLSTEHEIRFKSTTLVPALVLNNKDR